MFRNVHFRLKLRRRRLDPTTTGTLRRMRGRSRGWKRWRRRWSNKVPLGEKKKIHTYCQCQKSLSWMATINDESMRAHHSDHDRCNWFLLPDISQPVGGSCPWPFFSGVLSWFHWANISQPGVLFYCRCPRQTHWTASSTGPLWPRMFRHWRKFHLRFTKVSRLKSWLQFDSKCWSFKSFHSKDSTWHWQA